MAQHRFHTRLSARTLRGSALLIAVALAATACSRGDTTGSIRYPDDHRDRHPIVLGTKIKTLDLFALGSGIGQRQTDELEGFVLSHRREGRSPIMIQVPAGPGAGRDQAHAVTAIQRVLGRGGYQMSSYRAPDPQIAAPIRISYYALQASVPHKCDQWPEDLITSNNDARSQNQTHWNFGCAMQANLAAQVEDPLDFARARPEGRIDTAKRMGAIDKLRKGQDPSTQYRQEATSINQTVGAR